MNVGSPEPVITRHLCPAAIFTGLSVAAGVDVVRAAANATQPVTTATAIQRDGSVLRRIGCVLSRPGWWAIDLVSENVSGSVNSFVTKKSSCLPANCTGKYGLKFRNVPEHA